MQKSRSEYSIDYHTKFSKKMISDTLEASIKELENESRLIWEDKLSFSLTDIVEKFIEIYPLDIQEYVSSSKDVSMEWKSFKQKLRKLLTMVLCWKRFKNVNRWYYCLNYELLIWILYQNWANSLLIERYQQKIELINSM